MAQQPGHLSLVKKTEADLDEEQLHDLETREIVLLLYRKVTIIQGALGRCQSRCHVDNPPGRWRALYRAIAALFQRRQPEDGDDK
jgi:hypothetical protein